MRAAISAASNPVSSGHEILRDGSVSSPPVSLSWWVRLFCRISDERSMAGVRSGSESFLCCGCLV